MASFKAREHYLLPHETSLGGRVFHIAFLEAHDAQRTIDMCGEKRHTLIGPCDYLDIMKIPFIKLP